MRIEEDLKLDFRDVLIRPKRSTLSSRREVDLTRTYRFRHGQQAWTGIPIMASNMDGVGTWAMARSLAEHGMFTCLVKSQPSRIGIASVAPWMPIVSRSVPAPATWSSPNLK